jgi:hypothetical protein
VIPVHPGRRAAIRALERHADAIRARGVRRLYLFGSTARDEGGPRSDVDVFIDLKRGARFSLFDLMDLRTYLRRRLGVRVDVFPRDGLHRVIRAEIEREAVRVI